MVSFLGLGTGFAQRSQARRTVWPNRVYVVSFLYVTLLRTGCSPPAAPHPVLPRRSSLRLQASERFARRGLSPHRVYAITGARARTFQSVAIMERSTAPKNSATPLFFTLLRTGTSALRF